MLEGNRVIRLPDPRQKAILQGTGFRAGRNPETQRDPDPPQAIQ